MRSRFLIAALVLPLLAPQVAAAHETAEPNGMAVAAAKAPFIAYSALPYSEAAGAARGFLGAGDIRVMRADGSGDRSVTTGPATEFEPAFSPDGQLIAFSSDRADVTAGRTDIWVVRRDGTGMRRLTTGLNARSPAWSPDGRRIAAATDAGIVTFASNGKDLVKVTANTPANVDFAPVWNAAGTHIVFTRTTLANGATTGQSLWYAAVAGSPAKRLLGASAPSGFLSQPDISPDGMLVTFLQAHADGTAIWLADLSGKVLRRLALSRTGLLNSPAFSPDGKWVLFTHSGFDGRSPSSMRLVSAAGTKVKMVARTELGNYYAPSWDRSSARGPSAS